MTHPPGGDIVVAMGVVIIIVAGPMYLYEDISNDPLRHYATCSLTCHRQLTSKTDVNAQPNGAIALRGEKQFQFLPSMEASAANSAASVCFRSRKIANSYNGARRGRSPRKTTSCTECCENCKKLHQNCSKTAPTSFENCPKLPDQIRKLPHQIRKRTFKFENKIGLETAVFCLPGAPKLLETARKLFKNNENCQNNTASDHFYVTPKNKDC